MLSRQLHRCRLGLVTPTKTVVRSHKPIFGSRSSSTQKSSKVSDRSSRTTFISVTSAFAAGLIGGLAIQRSRIGAEEIREIPSPSTLQSIETNQPQIPGLNQLGTSDNITYASTPTSEEVTQKLNENAFSVSGSSAGFSRYDVAQLALNSPCEDAFVHGSFAHPFSDNGGNWLAWAAVGSVRSVHEGVKGGIHGRLPGRARYQGNGGQVGDNSADRRPNRCGTSEIARIQTQFPDEPGIVKGGRVWGMQPSRTFSDGMWKWSAQLKQTLRDHCNGLSLPSATRYKDYKEGTYLTAEPVVVTTEIPKTKQFFLIIATDGLWDTMMSEEAVALVGRWVDWQAQGGNASRTRDKTDFGLPVLGWKQQCKFEEDKATVRDQNVAVYLMRNGLGGEDDETVRGALTFRYPNSRDIRDDMTVQVVFSTPKTE